MEHHLLEAYFRPLAMVLLAVSLSSCAVKQTAVGIIGDALTGNGDVYMSDDDPDLVAEAIPFGLKTYEGLLASVPEHKGLLLATARGFTAYAFLLQRRADRIDHESLVQARALRGRAHKLYLRGRNYALRGLAVDHPHVPAVLSTDAERALVVTTRDDVDFLFWAGASWAGAIGTAKGDLDLLAELPIPGALVQRVLALDESYDAGGAHEFLITYEASRPDGSLDAARAHYHRAVELSGGTRSSVHLAFAEEVLVQEQNLVVFLDLIELVIQMDPNRVADYRLVNNMARRRAIWLRSRIPELFVDPDLEVNQS